MYRRDPSKLYQQRDSASVFLRLVEPDNENVQRILGQYGGGSASSKRSLVEFPKVLLASFHSTLLALQSMKQKGDIPFIEFLAPGGKSGHVAVPPPTYAMKPGFSFNLRCLMGNDTSLELKPGQPFDIRKLQEGSTLDDAQASTLVDTLQRRVGLIQGPPGTGKSYTGVAAVKVLLASKIKAKVNIGPIICVCYTNHALDQLLEVILDSGATTQIIRIGSQSKSDRIEGYILKTIARNAEKTRAEKYNSWALNQAMDGLEKEFFQCLPYLAAAGSGGSIKHYLSRHHRRHYQELFGQDDQGYKMAGNNKPQKTLNQWLHSGKAGAGRPRPLEKLQGAYLKDLSKTERKALHEHWIAEIRNDLQEQMKRILSSYDPKKTKYDALRTESDLRCLRTAGDIGVTTSGLALNLNMLQRVKAKVLLCEEAGEGKFYYWFR